MDCSLALEYFQAIEVIQAQDSLVEMNITDYPNMKREGRSKFYREMRKKGYPRELQPEMDFDAFFEKMGK